MNSVDERQHSPHHNDENSFFADKDSSMVDTRRVSSNSKRRRKKALTTINQNVAFHSDKLSNGENSDVKKEIHTIAAEIRQTDSESSCFEISTKDLQGSQRLLAKIKETPLVSSNIIRDDNVQFRSNGKETGTDKVKDKDSRRLKVVLNEKDRQLASLQHLVIV